MRPAGFDTAEAPLPSRLFWIPVLLIDIVLLAALPQAAKVAAGLLAAASILLLLSRPRVALAFAAAGTPLLNPIGEALGSEEPAWHLAWILIVLSLGLHYWGSLWGALRRQGQALTTDPMAWSVLLLGLVLAVGMLFTPSPSYGTMKVQFYFMVDLLLFVGAAVLLRPRIRPGGAESLSDAATGFVAALAVWQALIALAGALNWFLGFDPFPVRLSVLGTSTIWLARHMGMGILLVLALQAMGRLRAMPAALLVGLMGWVAYATGSRGPLVALAAALVLWFSAGGGARKEASGLRPPGRLRRVLTLILIASPLLLLPLASERLMEGRAVSNEVRSRILEIALDAIRQAGFRGLGTGGFSQLFSIGDQRFYPHNIFLELFLENGLPGLAVWIAFLALILARWTGWRRRWRASGGSLVERTLWRLTGAQLVFHLVNAQFSGDITVNQWIWLWAGALAAWSPRGRE